MKTMEMIIDRQDVLIAESECLFEIESDLKVDLGTRYYDFFYKSYAIYDGQILEIGVPNSSESFVGLFQKDSPKYVAILNPKFPDIIDHLFYGEQGDIRKCLRGLRNMLPANYLLTYNFEELRSFAEFYSLWAEDVSGLLKWFPADLDYEVLESNLRKCRTAEDLSKAEKRVIKDRRFEMLDVFVKKSEKLGVKSDFYEKAKLYLDSKIEKKWMYDIIDKYENDYT
jgi:hypothetical protein